MKTNNQKYFYIVLIKALTGLGKFSRFFTKYEYTHIAVSFNDLYDDFISFSRKRHYSPFDAGFMHEHREHYAFGNNETFQIKVFRLKVSQEETGKIKEYLSEIEQDGNYIFNLYSMLTMPVFHGFRIYKAFNCMSFTSKLLTMTSEVKLTKPYYKYSIKDIDLLLKNHLYFEGELKKEKQEDAEYMKRGIVFSNIFYFLKLNMLLIYRILFKRKKGNE